MSRYQKGKTNLDFTEARDSEWQWHQLGHMQVCTSLQPDNHASTPSLSFLQAGCPSCHPTNSVKALKAQFLIQQINNFNKEACDDRPIRRLSQCHPTKMFSTGEFVHKMLNTFDIQELSGTLTSNSRTLPGNFSETFIKFPVQYFQEEK